jgi:endonuclease YncB( thermonuclease family)
MPDMHTTVATLLAALLFAVTTGNASAETITGQASVIDGDTIEIHGTRIRLDGIDAPESAQPCIVNGQNGRCGRLSAMALDNLIGNQTVSCEWDEKDRYGRVIGTCSAGGQNLNAAMVADGWAMAYREYSVEYVPQENDARSTKRGIWQTEFVPPWDWRKQKRTQAEAKQQAGCVIKGNISTRTGERIYHVPGGQYYDKTAISTSAGERWFCSEAEARTAGWRRSKR